MMKIGIILLLITLIISAIAYTTLTKADLSGVQKKEYDPEIFGNIWSKKVEIFSNDGKEYSYIPVLVSVPENVEDIELYKKFDDGSQQKITEKSEYEFKKIDQNDNSKIDHISWIVPKVTKNVFLLEGRIGSVSVQILDKVTTNSPPVSTTTTIQKISDITPAVDIEVVESEENEDYIKTTTTEQTIDIEIEEYTTTIYTTTTIKTEDMELYVKLNEKVGYSILDKLAKQDILKDVIVPVQKEGEIGKPIAWEQKIILENRQKINKNIKLNIEVPMDSENFVVKENGRVVETNILKKSKSEIQIQIKIPLNQEKEIKIEYETSAPEKIESSTTEKNFILEKTVKIKSDSLLHYKNILTYSDIKESKKEQIKLYWLVDGEKNNVVNDPRFDVRFIDRNDNGLIDRILWIVPELSEQNFIVEVDLTILNVQSYPKFHGNWTVRFTTIGQDDLVITGVNGTKFEKDLEFLELRCGDKVLNSEITENTITYRNFSCDDRISYEISKVLTLGKHFLEFRFGNDAEYAKNTAMGTLECTVAESCSDTDIFHLSSTTNAHGELANNSVYNQIVCCVDNGGGATLGNDCSGTYSQVLLNLSSETNAHAELNNESNYAFGVCLSADKEIECGYASNCDNYDTCVASLSTSITGGTTNLHLADCGADAYATKICCSRNDSSNPLWNDTAGYLGSNTSNPSYKEAVLLYGMGYDDNNLDWAWLSTNETGSWKNYTLINDEWWNTSWNQIKKISFSIWTGPLTENLTDFPLLVKLNSSYIDYSYTKDDGTDIRFIDADNTTELSYHIELWNETGDSFVWVKVPLLDNSSTDHIWMYYDNSQAADVQDEANTYDANYVAVWHLNETSGTRYDSTGNKNNLTDQNTVSMNTSGKIAGSADFEKDNTEFLNISDADQTGLDFLDNYTIEFWINIESNPWLGLPVLQKYDSVHDDGNVILVVGDWNGTHDVLTVTHWVEWVLEKAYSPTSTSSSTSNNVWYHHAIIYDKASSTITFCRDSVCDNPVTMSQSLVDGNNDFTLGAAIMNPYYLDGKLDEVRISNEVRSAAWVNASYLSQSADFLSYEDIEGRTYGSPKNMADAAATWTWSNFTWDNSSVSDGQIIGWKIYYNDTLGNENVTSVQSFTIADTAPPTWQDISEGSSDPATYIYSPNYGFQINFTDNIGMKNVFFEHNASGSWANITCSNTGNIFYANITSLGVGVLNYTFIGNDTSGNQNRSSYNTFSVNKATPSLSGSITSPIDYGTESDYIGSENNDGDDSCSYSLLRNGTEIDTGSSVSDTTVLGIGAYNYTYYTSGCSNYTFGSDEIMLTVTSTTAKLSVLFNATGNATTYPAAALIQCNITDGDIGATLTLYRNGTQVSTGAGNRSVSENAGVGVWNYSCTYTASENYTASSNLDNYFTVNKAKPILILDNNTAAVNTSGLVGYWRLEEGSSAVKDYSGYGNNGTLQGGLDCAGDVGRFGDGCEFDGVDDYINLSENDAYYIDTVSLLSWVKIEPTEIRNISAGYYHGCVVLMNGSVLCWGYNSNGQLGDGTTDQRLIPTPVYGGYNFSQISSGSSHTCGILANGSMLCWGSNGNGQLGDGTTDEKHVPSPIYGGYNFSQIGSGSSHTCGILANGSMLCWGSNVYGRLGDGTTDEKHVPTPVYGGYNFTSLGLIYLSTCGILTNNSALCWGGNWLGQLGIGSSDYNSHSSPVPVSGGYQFSQIKPGGFHTCGLLTNGSVLCWGSNSNGQIGDGSTTQRTSPRSVSGGYSFIRIYALNLNSCGILTNGSMLCWGDNSNGQIGDGSTTQRTSPRSVSGGYSFTQVSLGFYTSCGISNNSFVFCWGGNNYGQMGDVTTSTKIYPLKVSGEYNFSSATMSNYESCGLLTNGSVLCWGSNSNGELGDGTTTQRDVPKPVSGGYNFNQISLFYDHTCGLLTNGSVLCWGDNYYGQIGDGTNTDRTSPRSVSGGHNFTFIETGGFHTCGLLTNGSVLCWGENDYGGELGDGTLNNKNKPVSVIGGHNFTALALGGLHSCGILINGSALCWGNNYYAELGIGNSEYGDYSTPISVLGGHNFTSINAGYDHTCGIITNGSMLCWGDNSEGQLGDGTKDEKDIPTEVSGGYNFSSVDSGGYNTCGILVNGSILCWGWNGYGQLGDGTTTQRTSPTPGYQFSQIKLGNYHTCGINSTGSMLCWGSNSKGQLGIGNGTFRLTPTKLIKGIILGKSGSTYALASTFDNDIVAFLDSEKLTETLSEDWHHVALTYDGSSMKLYVDSVETDSSSFTANDITLENSNLVIGKYNNGSLDELSVWNRELASNEIREFYESSVSYGTQTTFTGSDPNVGDDDVTYNFYRNITDKKSAENGTAVTLGVGYHYYLFNTSGGANYTESSILLPLDVSQTSSTISVLFTPDTNTSVYPATATIQCNMTVGDTGATLTLYRNGTQVSTGAGNRSVSENPGASVWNYTCIYTASTNYTATSNNNNYLTVSKGSSAINLLLNGTDGNKVYNISDIINSTIELTTPSGTTNTVYLGTNITGWVTDSGSSPHENITSVTVTAIYNFTGYWNGNANYTGASETHYVNVSQAAYLEVSLTTPPASQNVVQNQNFTLNATVYCRNGSCGNVEGVVQYNLSSTNPDTAVNKTTGDQPLFIQDSPQIALKSCPTNPLIEDEFCNLTWIINATGTENSQWKVGVLFNTSTSGIDDNHTANSTITITHCSCDISIWSPEIISFGTLSPNTNQNDATGNSGQSYNVTVNEGSCMSNLWIKGEDLTNTTYETSIGVGNITWSNETNTYASSHNMTIEYALLNASVIERKKATSYYWVNAPPILAGVYTGNITIFANESS